MISAEFCTHKIICSPQIWYLSAQQILLQIDRNPAKQIVEQYLK
jgi:hypothetical protein